MAATTPTLFHDYKPKPSRQRAGARGNNLGRAFETLIETSARCCDRMSLEQLPKTGAQFIGRGKFIPQPIACDFVGVAAGLPIFFDAKSREGKYRFAGWQDPQIIKEHQRRFLVRMGRAGAVSGILAEANELARVYWMPWQVLEDPSPSIEWADPRLVLVDELRVDQVLRFQNFIGWAIRTHKQG